MTQLFRSGSPFIAVLLLVYTLIVKLFFMMHPSAPVLQATDGLLFTWLTGYLDTVFQQQTLYYTLLSILLIFVQAMVLNRMVNHFRLLPGTTFLPAMSYLLMTSFFKEWNVFSASLLANTFLLAALSGMVRLYNRQSVRGLIFNTGFVIGIGALCYFPAILFLFLLWAALAINRPFHLSEWIVALMGILCPLYFLATGLFLAGHFSDISRIIMWGWTYPRWQHAYWAIGAVIIILGFFIYGALQLQQYFFKMLIQVRKIWLLLLAYAGIAILTAFLNPSFSVTAWILAIVPVAVYMANAWWSIKKSWLTDVLHLVMIAFVFGAAFFG